MNYGMSNPVTSSGSSLRSNSTGMREKVPSGYRKGSLQQFNPEQMQLFQQLFSHVNPESYLSKLSGGDQSMFEDMEAPAMRQLSELQGGLASRFSGAGLGGRHSSGFQNAASAQTSNFAQDLAAKRQEMQRQAIMDLMGISNSLLGQRPQEQYLVPKQQRGPSGFGKLFGGLAGGAGGFFAGGGFPGAIKGAKFGSELFGGF